MLTRINIPYNYIKITRCGDYEQSTFKSPFRITHHKKIWRPATASSFSKEVYSKCLEENEFTKRRVMAKKEIATIYPKLERDAMPTGSWSLEATSSCQLTARAWQLQTPAIDSRHHPANRLTSCLVSDEPEAQPRLPPPFP